MIFIVGDIHGEVTKLQALINYIESLDSSASFVFIGDYLDKGEDARKTLVFLMDLQKRKDCTFLMGNHEYVWLNLKQGDKEKEQYLLKYGGELTMKSFCSSTVFSAKTQMLSEFKVFFDKLVPFWENKDYVVVHSGISPSHFFFPLKEIPVEKLLFNRYDFIEYKSFFNEKKIIFGHTGFYFPYVDQFKIGIDTAACFLENQPLTAFCIEEEFFVDSSKSNVSLTSCNCDICPVIPRVKPYRLR